MYCVLMVSLGLLTFLSVFPNRNRHSTEQKKGVGTDANSLRQRYDKLRFLLNFAVNLQSKFKFFVTIPQISQDISGIISIYECGYVPDVGTMWVHFDHLKTKNPLRSDSEWVRGGDSRSRTDDPLLAKQVL